MNVTVSAPGKLMLLGEHAVVYGHPCLVTAVGQRMRCTLSLTSDRTLTLQAPDVGIEQYQKPMGELGTGTIPKGAGFVELALKNVHAQHPLLKEGVHIQTSSEFKSTFGFGSSSAATVCVVKGLSELLGLQLSNREVFDIAYKTVLDVQGKGSGFDIAAAVYGGTLYFYTGGKTIEPIEIDDLPLVVGYTGIKADTVTIVNEVLAKAAKNPQLIEGTYTSIDRLVEQAKEAAMREDWKAMGELMNVNQEYLETLGVSSDILDALIHAARDAGAYGAKLSGAGKGDCMIALVAPEKRAAVAQAIEKAGGQWMDIEVGAEGVRVENER